jgi:hypothetical protein
VPPPLSVPVVGQRECIDMSLATLTDVTAKPRRRLVNKSTQKHHAKSVKVGLYLSVEAARRLGITATMEGSDKSAIVDELINTHLRKYVVSVRGDKTGPEGTADTTISAS